MVARKERSRLDNLVNDYIERYRPGARERLEDFRKLRAVEEAVLRAALAQLPNGKRHPHQYRLSRLTLEESADRLRDNLALLRGAKSFDDLLEIVSCVSGPIPGIGELAVYDTTLRIGARLGLEPVRVYLHAGTRKGAKALGLNGKAQALDMDELPAPLRKLNAREAEDFLCIYKHCIAEDEPTRSCAPASRRARHAC